MNLSYDTATSKIIGTIEEVHRNGSKITMLIKGKEKVLVTYYCKSKEEKELLQEKIMLGDKIKITGTLTNPTSTKNFYSFSYQNYLKYQKIYHLFQAETITKIKSNQQLIYQMKQKIRSHIASLKQASGYVYTFFLGDTNYVDPKVKLAFQKIGISHLFALSGTQVSCLTVIFSKLLKKIKITKGKEFLLINFLLVIYYLLIDSCAAVDRALIFFFIFGLNKIFYFYIPPFSLILLSISILLFINPYYIFDIGFQYSTVISSGLLLSSKKLKCKNKLIELFKISWVSFLLSLPISLYHFSWMNVLSIFYNIFYVPLINFLIFPLSMLCVFCPFLKDILFISVSLLEESVLFLQQTPFGIIVLKRIDIYWYFIYYLFIIGYLYTNKSKVSFVLLSISLLVHFLLPHILLTNQLYMLDVGQGDSFLFVSDGALMLVDTGGKMSYQKQKWEQGFESLGGGQYIMQFIYQLGFSKIDKLVLTHGDADHAKEALTLLKNIKIEKIYFNDNEINSLEKKIILAARKRKIKTTKLKQDAILSLNNFTFQVLSTDLKEENDSSLILLGKIAGKNILMMGDASIKSEQQILNKYNLPAIDILKVGHHGSKTSSSLKFLQTIKPKHALISVGLNNKFNHPHSIVIKRLKEVGSRIYETTKQGMICFDFLDFKITTYS